MQRKTLKNLKTKKQNASLTIGDLSNWSLFSVMTVQKCDPANPKTCIDSARSIHYSRSTIE
jgi:hypothetical protein